MFIDYQNMYYGARRAFGDPRADSPIAGQIDPAALARLLIRMGRVVDPAPVLCATSVYKGEPGRFSHRKVRAAFAGQTRQWRFDSSLTVKTTPLRYRRDDQSGGKPWRAEEKGIQGQS